MWTEAEAHRPKTLQHPVKETSISATNGTSSFCIMIDSHLLGLKDDLFSVQVFASLLGSRPGQFVLDSPNTTYCRNN